MLWYFQPELACELLPVPAHVVYEAKSTTSTVYNLTNLPKKDRLISKPSPFRSGVLVD